jgi:hypothetical protein
LSGPFDDPEPGNVPLLAAPLVRVLAQVRFPQFSQFLSEEDQIARKFAALVADDYPLFEEGVETVFMLTPNGVSPQQGGSKLWRLRAADASWQISFAHNFVALETTSYGRRSDFADRFQKVWEAFRSVARPPFIERAGIRYTNRIERPEILEQLGAGQSSRHGVRTFPPASRSSPAFPRPTCRPGYSTWTRSTAGGLADTTATRSAKSS